MENVQKAQNTNQRDGTPQPKDESGLILRLDRLRPEKRLMTAKSPATRAPAAPVPVDPALPQPPVAPQRAKPKTPQQKKTVVYKSKRLTGLAEGVKDKVSGTLVSLLMLVALPTIAAGLYFAFVASPQYVSEFRFSVRPSDSSQFQSSMAIEAALAISNSFIVAEYAASRDAVDEMQESVDLRSMFTRDDIDFASRLSKDASIEGLVAYWKNRIATHFDMSTGISTITVTAFAPDDALKITNELKLLCEKLVNDISEKARQTQLAFSQTELDNSEKRLKDIRKQEVELRSGQKSIDARKEAENKLTLHARLRSNLSDLQSEYFTLSSYMDASSPKLVYLKKQINAAEQQIANLQAEVGAQSLSKDGRVVDDASRIAESDALQTDVDIATKLYESSLENFESARMKANSNQIYLATFIQPSLAQVAAYPRIFIDTFIFFLCAIGVWLILTLIYYSVRDHR